MNARCFLKCVNKVQNTVSFACAEIVDRKAGILGKLFDRAYMAVGKVNYMDIVPYSGAVVCLVIVAENIEMIELANRNLCDLRHKIVRDTVRILADPAALMSPDGVEIAQKDDIPGIVGSVNIRKDLLKH